MTANRDDFAIANRLIEVIRVDDDAVSDLGMHDFLLLVTG